MVAGRLEGWLLLLALLHLLSPGQPLVQGVPAGTLPPPPPPTDSGTAASPAPWEALFPRQPPSAPPPTPAGGDTGALGLWPWGRSRSISAPVSPMKKSVATGDGGTGGGESGNFSRLRPHHSYLSAAMAALRQEEPIASPSPTSFVSPSPSSPLAWRGVELGAEETLLLALPPDLLQQVTQHLKPPDLRNLRLAAPPLRHVPLHSAPPTAGAPIEPPPSGQDLRFHAPWDVQSVLQCIEARHDGCIQYWEARHATFTRRQNLTIFYFRLGMLPLRPATVEPLATLLGLVDQSSDWGPDLAARQEAALAFLVRKIHATLTLDPDIPWDYMNALHHVEVRTMHRLVLRSVDTFLHLCTKAQAAGWLSRARMLHCATLHHLNVQLRSWDISPIQHFRQLKGYLAAQLREEKEAWEQKVARLLLKYLGLKPPAYASLSEPGSPGATLDWNRGDPDSLLTGPYWFDGTRWVEEPSSSRALASSQPGPLERTLVHSIRFHFVHRHAHLPALLTHLLRDVGFYPSRGAVGCFLHQLVAILREQTPALLVGGTPTETLGEYCGALLRLVYETTGGYPRFLEDVSQLPCADSSLLGFLGYREEQKARRRREQGGPVGNSGDSPVPMQVD